MRFSKWHAHGNAYLVVEREDAGPLAAEVARRLCDPGTGVGADGVLEVLAGDPAGVEIVIWNPDGSVAEMSGNGTRIAAAWHAARRGTTSVEVRAGGRAIRTEVAPDGTIVQRVAPVVTGERETIRIDGRPVTFVPVDVGNPHAVVPSDAVTGDELRRIGPALERHPRFPGRTNVQLAQAAGRSAVDARVWERGVGETPSSGSSAVAVAAAAARLGWCDDRVTVRFPGGDLLVELDGSGASLTGPAVEICRGELAAR